MKAAKDLGVDGITTFGDLGLVLQEVKKVYQVNQPKLPNLETMYRKFGT